MGLVPGVPAGEVERLHHQGGDLQAASGREHGREGGLGQPERLALAGDRREGPVRLAVDDDQVDGVRADIQDGQAHQLDQLYRGSTMLLGYPAAGPG